MKRAMRRQAWRIEISQTILFHGNDMMMSVGSCAFIPKYIAIQ
jgi:hypothetical protein